MGFFIPVVLGEATEAIAATYEAVTAGEYLTAATEAYNGAKAVAKLEAMKPGSGEGLTQEVLIRMKKLADDLCSLTERPTVPVSNVISAASATEPFQNTCQRLAFLADVIMSAITSMPGVKLVLPTTAFNYQQPNFEDLGNHVSTREVLRRDRLSYDTQGIQFTNAYDLAAAIFGMCSADPGWVLGRGSTVSMLPTLEGVLCTINILNDLRMRAPASVRSCDSADVISTGRSGLALWLESISLDSDSGFTSFNEDYHVAVSLIRLYGNG